MKYTIKEIQKALDVIIKESGPTDVAIEVDPKSRLLFKYVDPLGGDQIIITVFPTEREFMATITRTEKL